MEDLIGHIKPAIRKNPDIVVIHVGTSDKSLYHFTIIATYYTLILHIIYNYCNIVKKANQLISAVKEVDKGKSVKVAFSSIINCEDDDLKDKINDVNNKLKNYDNSDYEIQISLD